MNQAEMVKELSRIADQLAAAKLSPQQAEELTEKAVAKAMLGVKKEIAERFDKIDLKENVEKVVRDFMQAEIKAGRGMPFPDEGSEARRVVSLAKAHRRPSRDPAIIEFQKAADDVYLLETFAKLARKRAPGGASDSHPDWGRRNERFEDFRDAAKSLYTSGAGVGLEWIPTSFSASLLERMELATRLWALFPQATIPMGADQLVIPVRGVNGVMYIMGEPVADGAAKITESTPGTGKITFDPAMFGIRYLYSVNMTEDSVVAMLPLLSADMVLVAAKGVEDLVLNGDTTAGHMDADVAAADDHRRAWKGIRKHCSTIGGLSFVDLGGAPSEDTVLALKKGLGEWAAFPEKCVWVVGINGWHALKKMASVKTIDTYGEQRATIVTGQIATLDGSPVVISPKMKQDLNASGVQDGVTTTKTLIGCIALEAWMTGRKRDLTIEQDKDIENGMLKLVGSFRADFQKIHDVAAARPGVIGYNLTN